MANTQKLDAYTLVDLDVAYGLGAMLGAQNATVRLTVSNLTNQKYVSTIITADNVLAASTTSSSFVAGAPMSAYAAFSLDF